MKMNDKTGQMTKSRWHIGILGALLISTIGSAVGGSRPAQGAFSCPIRGVLYLINPAVTALEGPGDAAAEQAHWSALEHSLLAGPLEMDLGQRTWQLERVP